MATVQEICQIAGVSVIQNKRRGSKLIVATNESNKGFEMRVEVEPDFSNTGDDIELVFELAVRRGVEKFQRVTIPDTVIQGALKNKTDVVAAAIESQFSWFEANYPEIGGKIFEKIAFKRVVAVAIYDLTAKLIFIVLELFFNINQSSIKLVFFCLVCFMQSCI